ncbi:MAG: AtpZ/AtpI family protein [Lachnospiraceae bacterium]|nr:AtpZ/AtpI family protein [Lachnospiraceae bacterium]
MKKNASPLKNLILITEVGLSFILPFVIALFFGKWLDDKFQTKIFLIIFLVLGFFSGLTAMIHLIRHFAPKKADDVKEETYDLMEAWKSEEKKEADREPEDESIL